MFHYESRESHLHLTELLRHYGVASGVLRLDSEIHTLRQRSKIFGFEKHFENFAMSFCVCRNGILSMFYHREVMRAAEILALVRTIVE